MATIFGVDPHNHVLSAVALDDRGGVLGTWNGAMSAKSLSILLGWAAELTPEATWAIEGSNNLGRRLALALTSAGADVRDVCPTRTAGRRRRRPGRGKSDVVDAEAIARELLAHPDLPRAFKSAEASMPDPVREELTVLVRARKQMVDRHRRLLNEAEALVGELPSRLMERLPRGASVAPRLAAAARVHFNGDHLTDLRLKLLRMKAQEHRLLVAQCALLERHLAPGGAQSESRRRGRRQRDGLDRHRQGFERATGVLARMPSVRIRHRDTAFLIANDHTRSGHDKWTAAYC